MKPLMIVMVLSLIGYAEMYSRGAPNTTCTSMMPGHGKPPQSGPSPYRLTFSKKTYQPNEEIRVILSGDATFKGFLIKPAAAKVQQGIGLPDITMPQDSPLDNLLMDPIKSVGSLRSDSPTTNNCPGNIHWEVLLAFQYTNLFSNWIYSKWKGFVPEEQKFPFRVEPYCQERLKHFDRATSLTSSLTHTDNSSKESVVFTWKAPSNDLGPIVFRYTVVQSKDIYWVNMVSEEITYNVDSASDRTKPSLFATFVLFLSHFFRKLF